MRLWGGNMEVERATFAAGSFWAVEARFLKVNGILRVRVGYTGGQKGKPSYQDVCLGHTHHAEAVEIEFDPHLVSYERLLEVFWDCHDPTTLNRQGFDVGVQYRSSIFYHNTEQREKALAAKAHIESLGMYDEPVVTEIVKASRFYVAEDYHQHYLAKLGNQSSLIDEML